MAASEVSAWGGFVVSLPACPGLLPAPNARPCRWVTRLGLSPRVGIPTARHLPDTHGSAWRGSRRLRGVGIPESRTRLASVRPPAEGALPPIPAGRGGGDTGDGGGGKGVTGRSNLRM